MIKTIVVPQTDIISLSVPQDFIGKEVEVIAFTKEECGFQNSDKPKQVSFAAVSLRTSDFKFNRDEANER